MQFFLVDFELVDTHGFIVRRKTSPLGILIVFTCEVCVNSLSPLLPPQYIVRSQSSGLDERGVRVPDQLAAFPVVISRMCLIIAQLILYGFDDDGVIARRQLVVLDNSLRESLGGNNRV